jgi:hypothetical protein
MIMEKVIVRLRKNFLEELNFTLVHNPCGLIIAKFYLLPHENNGKFIGRHAFLLVCQGI